MRTRTAPGQSRAIARGDELSVLREQARALRERVKELACLHAISTVLENRDASLDDVLRQTVEIVPSALQHPARACARLVIGSRQIATRGYRPGLRRIEARIHAGESRGTIEAAYHSGDAPFLVEEKRLLRIVANRVADIVRIKTAEQTLRSYQHQLRTLASELANAQERERRSIAIFLHDRIGQELVLAKLELRSARAGLQDPAILEPLETVLEQVLRDVRSLTFEVSPPVLYELGFEAALEWLADQMGPQHGLDIRLECPARPTSLEQDIRAALFRSVRELVANTIKHASASHLVVRVKRRASRLVVEVEDDGCGFDPGGAGQSAPAHGGFGLFSIREQLRGFGGSVQFDTAPGKGCRVRISVPLQPERGGK